MTNDCKLTFINLHPFRQVSTGTTLVAVEFADGVVLGADSRTSMGTYVANRVTDKLTPVSSNIMACRSGSAADTQAVTDIVKYKIDFLEIERGDKVPVQTAAYLFKVSQTGHQGLILPPLCVFPKMNTTSMFLSRVVK